MAETVHAAINPIYHTMSAIFDVESLGTDDLIEALPDGAYIVDPERKIIYWNAAAERITGWERSEVVGRCCSDNILVHVDKDGHPLCGREYCPLHRSMVTDQTSRKPMLIFARSKSGSRIPVEVTVSPLHDEHGQVIGGIEMFRDMSETMGDLNRARLIQKTSIRHKLPQDDRIRILTRYVPHDLVGGDFIHIESIDEDRYSILVADVMGHGIAAALYTMQLRSLCEEHHALLGTPSAFLALLNNGLCVLTQDDIHFATAVHLVVNANTGAIQYALAGHEHPMPCPTGTPDERGPCLGMLPDASYPSIDARMEHGDSLLLYTDGAIEVRNAEEQELGKDGLENKLRESMGENGQVLDRLEEALVRFNNDIRLEDDLTLVLVTWKGGDRVI